MDANEFRRLLGEMDEGDIVRAHIVTADPGPFVLESSLRHIEGVLRQKFQIGAEQRLSAIVVGSAKLGFSFLEKRVEGKIVKPAYREYRPGASDVDVAIVSPAVYSKIWADLASTGAHTQYFPTSSKLSRYMYHGWLRPDHFPYPKPQRCTDWDDAFRELKNYAPLRNKQLRLALYHSQHFLEVYQQRGIRVAKEQEQIL